jgi:hypothetical protein
MKIHKVILDFKRMSFSFYVFRTECAAAAHWQETASHRLYENFSFYFHLWNVCTVCFAWPQKVLVFKIGLCTVTTLLRSVGARSREGKIGFIWREVGIWWNGTVSTQINVIWGNNLLLVQVGLPECGRDQIDNIAPPSGLTCAFINIPAIQNSLWFCPCLYTANENFMLF